MDPLPPAKFQARPWRYNRKRRRSGTEAGETEGDGKISKKESDATAAATPASTDKMETDTK